jgi:hypothetical protein
MDPILGENLGKDFEKDLGRVPVRILVEDLVPSAIQIPAHRRIQGRDLIQALPACSNGRLCPGGVTMTATTRRTSKLVLASDSKPNPVNLEDVPRDLSLPCAVSFG